MIDEWEPSLHELPARDAAAALAATGGDADLADELLRALLADLPVELVRLRGAGSREDWAELVETAHRLRGATRYCGVPALDTAIEALERVARSGVGADILSGLAVVEDQARRLLSACAS